MQDDFFQVRPRGWRFEVICEGCEMQAVAIPVEERVEHSPGYYSFLSVWKLSCECQCFDHQVEASFGGAVERLTHLDQTTQEDFTLQLPC